MKVAPEHLSALKSREVVWLSTFLNTLDKIDITSLNYSISRAVDSADICLSAFDKRFDKE